LKNKNFITVLVLHIILLLGISFYVFTFNYSSLHEAAPLKIPSFLYLCSSLWILISWYLLTKSLFNPYILFMLAALFFNGGQIYLELFDLNKKGFLTKLFPLESELQGIFYVNLSVLMFHLGGILSCASIELPFLENISSAAYEKFQDIKQKARFEGNDINAIQKVGLLLLTVSLFPSFYLLFNAIQLVRQFGYLNLYKQVIPTGFGASMIILADFLFPAIFFLVYSTKNIKRNYGYAAIAFLYTVTKLWLGNRAHATMPLLSLAWLWDKYVKKIPRSLLIGTAVFLLLIVFPLIASTRNVAGDDRFSLDYILNVFFNMDNPAFLIITEIGGSMMTVCWTMDLVPLRREFAMGTSYITAMLLLVPNFFYEGRHPAIDLFGYEISDFWLVKEVNPDFARDGGSYGFSFIAESYLNFGWYGVFFLLLLGFFYGKFVNASLKNSAMSIVQAIFLPHFMFYARGSSEALLRALVWYGFVPLILVRTLKSKYKKLK
jgi:hypothetical protein